MGSGRDKRKKHEDPAKAVKRASRQAAKANKSAAKAGEQGGEEGTNAFEDGFNNEEAIEVTLTRLRKAESKKKTTTEKEVLPPTPRANVVFVGHPLRDQELVVFGGELWNGVSTVAYNDLYIFNLAKQKWSLVDTPINPSPRSSAQGLVYKHFLIVHGGEFVSQTQSQFLHFKDVWRFDFRSYIWEELKQLKGGPSSRSGHRMALWKRQGVVFGGFYDNAQECRYFNDLWLLSDMDANGRWRQVQFPTHNEPPHARSGHAVGVYQDTYFVYGGYSSQKFNRFKKSEATVHHDLWSTNLSAEQPVWTKIRLGGIPPPIRAGVAAVTRDKQMLLFGGVVDIEAPGGKMVSTFHNDLFSFHMDSQRFYPLTLQAAKSKKSGLSKDEDGKKKTGGNTLEAELAALNLKNQSKKSTGDDSEDDEDSTSEDDRSSDNSDDEHDATADATTTEAGGDQPQRFSYETNRHGQITPHRRMDTSLCAVGHTLYLFGGQFESGKKEITITDLFSLNLNTRETWVTHCAQNLKDSVWAGHDSDSDAANSWESGSTVVSAVMFGDHGDEDDDDLESNAGEGGPSEYGNLGGDAIPSELDMEATPAVDELSGRTTGAKRGMQAHKAQLIAQLGASSLVPTPLSSEESMNEFFERTIEFWLHTACECRYGSNDISLLNAKDARLCKLEARAFCRTRYDEAIVLMEQLRVVEEREKEELEFFKKRREEKEAAWLESERSAAAANAGHSSDEEEDVPDAVPVAKRGGVEVVPKGILKSALKGGNQHVDPNNNSDDDSEDDEDDEDDDES